MAKLRKVEVVEGEGKFTDPHTLAVTGKDACTIQFENAIIAAGSRPIQLPFMPEDPRVIDSTGALELADIPQQHAGRWWWDYWFGNGDGLFSVGFKNYRCRINRFYFARCRQRYRNAVI